MSNLVQKYNLYARILANKYLLTSLMLANALALSLLLLLLLPSPLLMPSSGMLLILLSSVRERFRIEKRSQERIGMEYMEHKDVQ